MFLLRLLFGSTLRRMNVDLFRSARDRVLCYVEGLGMAFPAVFFCDVIGRLAPSLDIASTVFSCGGFFRAILSGDRLLRRVAGSSRRSLSLGVFSDSKKCLNWLLAFGYAFCYYTPYC